MNKILQTYPEGGGENFIILNEKTIYYKDISDLWNILCFGPSSKYNCEVSMSMDEVNKLIDNNFRGTIIYPKRKNEQGYYAYVIPLIRLDKYDSCEILEGSPELVCYKNFNDLYAKISKIGEVPGFAKDIITNDIYNRAKHIMHRPRRFLIPIKDDGLLYNKKMTSIKIPSDYAYWLFVHSRQICNTINPDIYSKKQYGLNLPKFYFKLQIYIDQDDMQNNEYIIHCYDKKRNTTDKDIVMIINIYKKRTHWLVKYYFDTDIGIDKHLLKSKITYLDSRNKFHLGYFYPNKFIYESELSDFPIVFNYGNRYRMQYIDSSEIIPKIIRYCGEQVVEREILSD